jgi:hypothetical protein
MGAAIFLSFMKALIDAEYNKQMKEAGLVYRKLNWKVLSVYFLIFFSSALVLFGYYH